jgi:hypothetical protein
MSNVERTIFATKNTMEGPKIVDGHSLLDEKVIVFDFAVQIPQ